MANDIIDLKFLINDMLRTYGSDPNLSSDMTKAAPAMPPEYGRVAGSYSPRQSVGRGEFTSKNIEGTINPSFLKKQLNLPVGVSGGYSTSEYRDRLPDEMRQIAAEYGLDLADPVSRRAAYELAISADVNIPVGSVGEITNLRGQYGQQDVTMTDLMGNSDSMQGRTRGLGLEGLINDLGKASVSYNEQSGFGGKTKRQVNARLRVPF
jgi:hypothetical protein